MHLLVGSLAGLCLLLAGVPVTSLARPAAPGLPPAERALDGHPVPASWTGIWLYQNTTKNCTTGQVISTSSYSDTLCPGEIVLPGGGFYETCTGGYSETSFTSDCTVSREFLPGCQASYRLVQNGTRTGDSFEGTGRSTTTFSGAGCTGLADQCFDFVTTGTRFGAAPSNCGTPVEPKSWGGIKCSYR